jgi:chemotaxis methyl-accepting protein methylase
MNVTDFFRDDSAWEYLGKQIIPNIMRCKKMVSIFTFGLLVVLLEKRLIL